MNPYKIYLKGTIIVEIKYKKKQEGQKIPSHNRKKLSLDKIDIQIIESTLALNQSCLSKEEQEKVYNMLVKYKLAFVYRDEISACPNIEVDL